MRGKVCIVTGASSGIGKETAVALAAAGADVAIVCRTADRGQPALAEIRARSGNSDVSLYVADLSSQRAIRGLAARLAGTLPRVDVLVNNAGLILNERVLTEDGLETTFAVNHLAYFLLARLLEPTLVASAPARIVNVASRAHHSGRLRFEDLMGTTRYRGWQAYTQSKLANVMFTYEHARRLLGTGVTANCLHPGVVASNFGHAGPLLNRLGARLGAPFLKSVRRGAVTSVYLASSSQVEGVTGKYFVNAREARSSKRSYDPESAERLWRVSEELTTPAADERP